MILKEKGSQIVGGVIVTCMDKKLEGNVQELLVEKVEQLELQKLEKQHL